MLNDSSFDAAHSALSNWDIKSRDIKLLSQTENIVFKVVGAKSESFVLRLHRPGYHNYRELLSEQQWTEALLDAGLDVPVPRPTREGQPYASVVIGKQHRYVGILEWVDGIPMKNLIDSNPGTVFIEDSFSLLGEIMARFHNQAVSWDIPPEFSRHSFDADGLVGERPFWGRFWESSVLTSNQKIYLDILRRQIYDLLAKLRRDSRIYSLIHADLHPANIVVEGQRLHVIDFDDSGFGWHYYDIAVALFNYHLEIPIEHLQTAVVSGYRKARSISDEDLSYIPLFMLIRALALIGWYSARPEVEAGATTLPQLINYVRSKGVDVMAGHGLLIKPMPGI
ncbi:phosphotransferase [Gammaproteobacteria bacterium]|nr:phosphotransferase [Gammaproteobacteria bacterium]